MEGEKDDGEMLVVVMVTIVDEIVDDHAWGRGCSRYLKVDGEVVSADQAGRRGWKGRWSGFRRSGALSAS